MTVLTRDISDFAHRQGELIKAYYGLTRDADFAQLSLAKLQEEAGEVAEAFLAYRRLQREDKLVHSDEELRANLGRELADVAVVVALLADAVGLRFHDILAGRVEELTARRPALLEVINSRRSAAWDRASPIPDQLELPLDIPQWT